MILIIILVIKGDKNGVSSKGNDIRLDNFLASCMDISRSQVTKMIKSNEVLVNGKLVKAGFMLKAGDKVLVNHVEANGLEAEKLDLDIVYEDDDCNCS